MLRNKWFSWRWRLAGDFLVALHTVKTPARRRRHNVEQEAFNQMRCRTIVNPLRVVPAS